MDEDDVDQKKSGGKDGAQAAGEGTNSTAQGKNAAKAARKKARKEREKLAKEQAALAQATPAETKGVAKPESLSDLKSDVMGLTNQINSDLVSKAEIHVSQVVDDEAVATKGVAISSVASATGPTFDAEESQKGKAKASKRRQRKKARRVAEAADAGDADQSAVVKDDPVVNEFTKLMDKNKISAIGLGEEGIQSVAQKKAVEAIAEAIISRKGENDPAEDPTRILEVLEKQDYLLRRTEGEQAEMFKKMLFPDGDFSDSSKSESGS
jgi:hypothetical protein